MSDYYDYDLDDLLEETTDDLENLENNLEQSQEDIESELQDVSKELQKKVKDLSKALKKDVRSEVLNYYHDNKDVIKTDLKSLNATIKGLLSDVKSEINDAIDDSDDSDLTKELKSLKHGVVKFSRKYNHKYRELRMKLFFGNAGVSIKDFFKSL